eukprot:8049963-Ditylum_brightwellii.AAC.1
MFEGDGCAGRNLDIVNDAELLSNTCQLLPQIPGTNKTVCDSVVVVAYDNHYATFEGELTNNEICQAQVTTCVFYEENTAA